MDTKLLGLILQGDKKNEREFNRIKETYEELSNSKANTIIGSANGESIVLSDSSDSKLDSLRVMGKTEQKTYSGKNLFKNSAVSQTINGVTFVMNEDGSVTANGTATDTTVLVICDEISLAAGNYVLSGCPTGGTNGSGVFYKLDLVKGTNAIIGDVGTTVTFTIAEPLVCAGRIVVYSGITLKDARFYPQIRYSSVSDASYEPYTGGIPSPSPQYPQELASVDDADVMVHGKNLLKNTAKHATSNGVTFTINADGSVTASGTSTGLSAMIVDTFVLKRGEYIFSGSPSGSVYNNLDMYVITHDTRTVIARSYDGSTMDRFSVEEDIEVEVTIRLRPAAPVTTCTFYPMIRLASIADGTYEPYKEQTLAALAPNGLPGIKVTDPSIATYTDEDGQMWCADEVDFARGVYVQRVKKCDVTGSTITWYVANEYFCELKPDDLLNKDGRSPVMSNCFHYSQSTKVEGDAFAYKSTIRLYKTFADLSEARTWFDNNDVNVMYILATPIETPLSESDLEAYKTLHTNYPVTTILNDSGAHMEVKYTADKKNYIDNKFAQIMNAVLSMGSNI